MELHPVEILPDLWSFGDSCNVYVLKRGDEAIAVDFGSGRWLVHLQALGIKRLTHVFLTHHHADQCSGLQNHALGVFKIHAPGGEEQYLDPACQHNGSFDIRYKGCPDSYVVLRGGIESITYDMAGFSDFFWGDQRIRFVHTPGHGRHACSIVIDHAGKQVVFCGDAAYAGATIWQPYHLEWDHWTGTGVLAAWEGIQRLYGIAVDMLCPSHGPVIAQQPRMMLKQLARKLMLVYHTKGQISIGEPDAYIMPQTLSSGAHRLSEHLYHFGANGYLIIGGNGGGLVIDTPGMRELQFWGGEEGVAEAFADIQALAARCRFSNCGHTNEPGCAVLAALVTAELARERFEAYSKLKAEQLAGVPAERKPGALASKPGWRRNFHAPKTYRNGQHDAD